MPATPLAVCREPAQLSPRLVELNGSLLGVGSQVPARVVSNQCLIEGRSLDTTAEWIESRTGIRERRFAEATDSLSSMAAQAARQALQQASVAPDDLTLIVVATSTSDYKMPSTAALVQQELGACRAVAFDINAACAGFVYAMDITLRCLQSLGGTALVIGADRGSSLPDPRDRTAGIFFGDAAAAVIVGASGPGRVLASELHAAGALEPLSVPTGGCMSMNGRAIWDFATRVLPETVQSLCRAAGLGVHELDLIVPHQANANIIRHAADELGIPIERFAINIERYGNTVAASVPLALDEALRSGRAQRGDLVALVGFGAGLCWGGQLLQL
jgi:3-oxoacyl-[acyl-carrier-protein] synthase-3